mmetsp:Transcript_15665/g.47229  ORF Transcript_15665/g.47229 Transcript_15665/m.47229 type:complete len:258 (+) Transcript_15665:704-1477(+)
MAAAARRMAVAPCSRSDSVCAAETATRKLGGRGAAPCLAQRSLSARRWTASRVPPCCWACSATSDSRASPWLWVAAGDSSRRCSCGELASSGPPTSCRPGTSARRWRMRRALAVAAAASWAPSRCMRASAPVAAVARYGGSAAEKQYPAPLRRWWSTISRSPAQKPPMLARELPREAAMMSTSRGCSPACSAAPRPVLPSTPSDMLSSTTSRYLYLYLRAQIACRGARSPALTYIPSTTMYRRFSGFVLRLSAAATF